MPYSLFGQFLKKPDKKADLDEAVVVRGRTVFNSLLISVTTIAAVIGFLIQQYLLAGITLSSSIIFLFFHFSLMRSKWIRLWGILTSAIISVDAIIAFYFTGDLSETVLFFILLYPIAVLKIANGKNLLLVFPLLILIITGNYISFGRDYTQVGTMDLVIFSASYLVISISIKYFYHILYDNLVHFKQRADLFEKEIHERDEFIIRLSHQLRTSLSNITLINNLVHDSRMTHSQKELLNTLKVSTLDLVNNVNELVETATPSIIDYKQSILSFNLKEILESSKDILYADQLIDHDIKISGDENLKYQIIGDPGLLRSIIVNLIKGILKYTSNKREFAISIVIESETQHKYRLKFIIDFGKETEEVISALTNDLTFDDKVKSSPLSNAKKLLKLIDCKPVIINNEKGYAIAFKEEYAKDPIREILSPVKEEKERSLPRIKSLNQSNLLLVEDNAINQKIVLLSLEKLVKNIDVANNGKEALDMFGSKTYDAILMDIQMPVMDGITATKKIRELESTSKVRIPIIAITANVLSGDRDICLAAGADEYLSKPFQVEDLVQSLSVLINATADI